MASIQFNHYNKKRKEIGKESGNSKLLSSKSQKRSQPPPITAGQTISQQRQPLPLAGKIVALSTLCDKNSNSSDGGDGDGVGSGSKRGLTSATGGGTESYNELQELCQRAGATVTRQLHKRVYCVIATPSAIAGQTQRVRKAWNYSNKSKLACPVVRETWIYECIKQNKLVPLEAYQVPPRPAQEKRTETEKKTSAAVEKDSHTKTAVTEMEEKQLDLGCCCACHELGTSNECPWCTDCSS